MPSSATLDLSSLTPPGSWQEEAACHDADPEVFFSNHEEHQKAALAMCTACPVRKQCLGHALATREPYGIWGGADEHERKRLMRRRVA